MPSCFVSGTGTDVGKTIASAWLCLHWDAAYWKPVQAGNVPCTDTERVQELTGFPPTRFFPSSYSLEMAASPHVAAAAQGIQIHPKNIHVPSSAHSLVIEGAGGLMVPLNDEALFIDWLAAHQLPTVLVVHTVLGCINHSLLSLEALERRGIPLAGIIFNDGGRPESEGIILKKANAPLLGRIPRLATLDRASLLAVPMLCQPLI